METETREKRAAYYRQILQVTPLPEDDELQLVSDIIHGVQERGESPSNTVFLTGFYCYLLGVMMGKQKERAKHHR